MRVLNNIRSLALPLSLVTLLVAAFALSGCREEVGCTTRTADNYNPDAVRDDGSCVNARDKFLGIYDITHICWPDTMLPLPRYMTIATDDLRVAEDDIRILNFGEDSIEVRGLVNKHFITIPLQALSVRGIPMKFTGEGHIDENGYLTILYTTRLMNDQLVNEDCVIFGQRLDN